jgi:hypothetical protein
MRVTPLMALALGFDRSGHRRGVAENRSLQVVAESPDFYRSSQIQLDGAQATPLRLEFRDLPTGLRR